MPFAASIWGPDPSPAACRVFLEEFTSQDHQQLLPLLLMMSAPGTTNPRSGIFFGQPTTWVSRDQMNSSALEFW